MISFYQRFVSPLLHSLTHYLFGPFSGCRFFPTCSEYYKISLKKYGFIKGNLKGLFRILRCNPFFSGGVDNP